MGFTLTDSYFSAWSNEDGFQEKDVDSICNYVQSSKTGDLDSTGENGTGFKSVFKVADKVTILSYPYSFTFDTTSDLKELGMLIPTWVNRTTSPEDGTTVTLWLREGEKIRSSLSEQLQNFDFYSMLFLRAIRRITITNKVKEPRCTATGVLREDAERTKQLVMKRKTGGRTDTTHETFITLNFDAEPAISIETRTWPTTIKFAFPVIDGDETGSHRKHHQKYRTYAFQAIQDFGFSVCHGLSAQRLLDMER